VDVARRIEKDRTFILKRMAYNRRRYRRLYDSDPEFRRRLLLKTKNWKEKNPDRIRLAATCRSRKRWAIKRKADGHHTPNEIKALLVKQKKRCIYCLESLVVGYHVDHIKPLSKGGGNGIGNIQLLCPTCNLRKHAKDPIKWANEIGLLL
jgi:5-methylcytosine-specific restriction endonuclease McrA